MDGQLGRSVNGLELTVYSRKAANFSYSLRIHFLNQKSRPLGEIKKFTAARAEHLILLGFHVLEATLFGCPRFDNIFHHSDSR